MDHIIPKSRGGTDVPDNMVASCRDCNEAKDNLLLNEWQNELITKKTKINKIRLKNISYIRKQVKKPLKEAAHVQSMKTQLLKDLSKQSQVIETNGVATKLMREEISLPKTHYNDAIAIALENPIKVTQCETLYKIRQVRKKKRSLHEANPRKGRGKPNMQAKRNSKNTKEIAINNKKWCLWDKVFIPQIDAVGYISGFTGKWVYAQDIGGMYVQTSSNYKQINTKNIELICRNNNFITERTTLSSPH